MNNSLLLLLKPFNYYVFVNAGHDGDGIGSGWYLDKVIVSNGDAAQQTFKCDRWLDVSEDDNAIERELIPTDDIQNDLDCKSYIYILKLVPK